MWSTQPVQGDNWQWLWLHVDRWTIRCSPSPTQPPSQHPAVIHQFILACGQYSFTRSCFFFFPFLPSALNYRERKNQGTFLLPSSRPLCLHVLLRVHHIKCHPTAIRLWVQVAYKTLPQWGCGHFNYMERLASQGTHKSRTFVLMSVTDSWSEFGQSRNECGLFSCWFCDENRYKVCDLHVADLYRKVPPLRSLSN